jgi:hypothetical protein
LHRPRRGFGPIVAAGDVRGDVDWLQPATDDEALRPGSGVSRRVLIRPGDELLIKPEYLQGSMQHARIDSVAVLSWSIPLGSLATGMIGLTRIRVADAQFATLSATQDMFDEVAVIAIPAGAGLVFKPSNLIGVLQPEDRPVRIHRLWRLGHASAWLTLQLRFLLFEGPCALVVKGARGVVLEPAACGRRIAGAATMGWSPALRYSVRRSETFLAYLTGKQSLFNDGFEGDGKVVYEEVPRARSRGGIVGRGLEGLGDGLLKVSAYNGRGQPRHATTKHRTRRVPQLQALNRSALLQSGNWASHGKRRSALADPLLARQAVCGSAFRLIRASASAVSIPHNWDRLSHFSDYRARVRTFTSSVTPPGGR